MLHGVTRNPTLWQTDGDLIYFDLFSLIFANFVLMVILEFFGIRCLCRAGLRKYFCCRDYGHGIIGAYGTNKSDVRCLLRFWVRDSGDIIADAGVPLDAVRARKHSGQHGGNKPPPVAAVTKGDFWKFFTSPLANVLMFLTIASIGGR